MISLSNLAVDGLRKFLGSYLPDGVSAMVLSNEVDISPVSLFVLVLEIIFEFKGLYTIVSYMLKFLVF